MNRRLDFIASEIDGARLAAARRVAAWLLSMDVPDDTDTSPDARRFRVVVRHLLHLSTPAAQAAILPLLERET